MASSGYPQLPTTVWRGVWQLLNKAPTRKLDDRMLAAELGVQSTAAKQYLKELQKLNILNADGQPTDVADKWRQNGNDLKVIGEILEGAYPEGLRELAPPTDLDREKVIRWFQGEKLGIGAAKNKAATYIMVASGVPDEVPKTPGPNGRKKREKASPTAPTTTTSERSAPTKGQPPRESRRKPQLAVNVQIHISADASAQQIEAIFSSMRKYFDDAEDF